jgi:hypothetical protein
MPDANTRTKTDILPSATRRKQTLADNKICRAARDALTLAPHTLPPPPPAPAQPQPQAEKKAGEDAGGARASVADARPLRAGLPQEGVQSGSELSFIGQCVHLVPKEISQ